MALEGGVKLSERSLEAQPIRAKLEGATERKGASAVRPDRVARNRGLKRRGALKRSGFPFGVCEGGRGEGAGAWTGWRREGRARPA